MSTHSFFDTTFMVGLAFLVLCLFLVKPAWKTLIEKLETHKQAVALECKKIDQILEEAQHRLEYAETVLEQFETKKNALLHHMEHHMNQLETLFQQELAHKEHCEILRFQTQCETLLESWKKEAHYRFMTELRIQLTTLLQDNIPRYTEINNSLFQGFLKEHEL